MRKQGLTILNTVLTLVITAICIFLFFFFIGNLYGAVRQDSDTDRAERSFDELLAQINALEEGDSILYPLVLPREWYLVYYDEFVVTRDPYKDMPPRCNGESCICMCPGIFPGTPDREKLRGGNPDYFYYSEEGIFNGVGFCESRGMCEPLSHGQIDNTVTYRVWAGILQKDETGPVNWIPFTEGEYIGNQIMLHKENGVVRIQEVPDE